MKLTTLLASLTLVACAGHSVEVPADEDVGSPDEIKTAPAPTTSASPPAAPATESTDTSVPTEPAEPSPPDATPAPTPADPPPCTHPNVAVLCSNGSCVCGAGPKKGQSCADAQTCKQVCAYCN